MNRRFRNYAIIAAAVIGMTLVACSGGSASTPAPTTAVEVTSTSTSIPLNPTATPSSPDTANGVRSEIRDFTLQDLTIPMGTMVTWVNRDTAPHTTTAGTSPDPSGEWDSSSLTEGSEFSFNFNEAGSFPYFCAIHPFMTATITVTGPDSSAATATPVPPTPTAVAATPTPIPPTPEPVTITSEIREFTLQDLTIPMGTTVTWVNRDGASHTTTAGTSPGPSGEWDSGRLSQDFDFSFTFDEAGSFPYFCAIHPFMTATITVTGPSS